MVNNFIIALGGDLLVLFIAFLIHEFGHIIVFTIITGKIPPIKVHPKWLWVQVGDEKYMGNITLEDNMFSALMGILLGLMYLSFAVAGTGLWFVYLLMSVVDISIIVQYFIGKEFRKTKIKYIKTTDVTPHD